MTHLTSITKRTKTLTAGFLLGYLTARLAPAIKERRDQTHLIAALRRRNETLENENREARHADTHQNEVKA